MADDVIEMRESGLPGMDNYQLWRAAGNTGTLAEFLDMQEAAAAAQAAIAAAAAGTAQTAAARFGTFAAPSVGAGVVDDARNLVGAFDDTEINHPQARSHDQFVLRERAAKRLAGTRRLFGSVAHLLVNGQSLAAGYEAQRAYADAPALANALRFFGGVRAADGGATDAAKYGSTFVAYSEQDSASLGQTMGYSLIDMFTQLVLRENGIDLTATGQNFLGSNVAEPGTAIAGLMAGTAPYQRMLDDITNGASIAQAAGHSYQLLAQIWQQGQSDTVSTTKASYKAGFRTLHTGVAAQGASVGGLPAPLPSLMFGLSTWPSLAGATAANVINQAILELCDEDADKFFVAPEYAFPFVQRNNIHWSNAAQLIAGATAGVVLKRIVWDGIDPDRIRALTPAVQGDTITIPFHVPSGTPLLVDTSRWAPANLGVNLVAADGATAIALADVRLVGGDRVKVRASAALPAHFFVRFGGTANDVGPAAVTSIRDSQGDRLPYFFKGVAIPIHNWMPNFELEIGA